MTTLRELIARQYLTSETDLEVILKWFIENNLEQEGLELIPKLAKSKSDKLEEVLNYARSWIPNTIIPLPKRSKGAKKIHYYDAPTTHNLSLIVQCSILKVELPPYLKEWAEKTIPTMDTPTLFFMPTVEWLKDKYNIRFKDDMKNE